MVGGIVAFGLLAGCGTDPGATGADEDGGEDLKQGYTACGAATCAPGQYCEGGFACSDGCVSDENCLDGYTCAVDPLFADGICEADEDTDHSTPPEEAEDALASCRSAVDTFQACGLTAADAAALRTLCETASEAEQHALGECGDLDCDAAVECLGYECFTDEQCDGRASCLGLLCV